MHIIHNHDIGLLVLAGLLCTLGSWVTSRLFRHTKKRSSLPPATWIALTAITAGTTIWGTHFVAMLGFRPGVPMNLDLGITFASMVIAIVGSGAGLVTAVSFRWKYSVSIGGAILGLAIAAMHYTGMMAYHFQGAVNWHLEYLAVSVLLAIGFSVLAVVRGRRIERAGEYQMAGALTLAILSLHFTGMAAFDVVPVKFSGTYMNPEAFRVLALTTTGTAVVVVLGALFSHLIERRARLESIAELKAARDAAEEANRAKSEFMSVLSHELRTPLTIVLGYAGILSRLQEIHGAKLQPHEGTLPPEAAQLGEQAELYGQKISTAAKHLLGMINEILDYTSMELGEAKLAKASFSVSELLEELRDQFHVLAENKNTVITVEAEDITAYADRGRVLQVLINLLGNAVKFSGATEVTLRGRFRPSGGFIIEVADNGRGIPEAEQKRIFDAFCQVDDADKRSEGGVGLGLAISRKLVNAHGGDLLIESAPGHGATFSVLLPVEAICASAGQPANTNRRGRFKRKA